MFMFWLKGFFSLLKELYFDKGEDVSITSKGFKLKRWVGMTVSIFFIAATCYLFMQLVEVGKELEIMQSKIDMVMLLECEKDELLLEIKSLKEIVAKQNTATSP